jgi:hypothetical protein
MVNGQPANVGTVSWLVPPFQSLTGLIRISNSSLTSQNDVSDANFYIIDAAPDKYYGGSYDGHSSGDNSSPSITLASPNGGETWYVGSQQTITWTSNNVNLLNLDVSTDFGFTWVSIVSNWPAGVGSYPWTVSGAGGTNCLVRAASSVQPTVVFDLSNATFAIPVQVSEKFNGGSFDGHASQANTPPVITVASPNGSETLFPGNNVNITWTSTNVSNVGIEFSSNNGSSWSNIVPAISASLGSYLWNTPYLGTNTALVRVYDVNSPGSINDQSNAVFTILHSAVEKFAGGSFDGFDASQMLTTATLSGRDTICLGTSTNLTVSFTGSSPWSITYTDGTQPRSITGIAVNPYLISVTPTGNTTYAITSVSGSGGVGVGLGNRVVTTRSIPQASVSLSSDTICNGQTAFLNVYLNGGTSPWTFTYTIGTTPVVQTGIIQTTLNLPVSPISTTRYAAVSVNDAFCAGVASGVDTLIVRQLATAILSGAQTICSGSSTTITTSLTGTAPWSLVLTNGTSNQSINGINASPYSFSVTPTQTSTYSLISVTDFCGAGQSVGGQATIQVDPLPQATLTTGQTICQGSTAQLSVQLVGLSPWNLSWTEGTTPMSATGITSNPYIVNTTPSSTETYSLVSVSANCGAGLASGTVPVVVIPPPTAVLTGSQTLFNYQNAQMTVQFTGVAPWDITYSDGTTSSVTTGITATPYFFTVSVTSNRTYSLTNVSTGICSGSASGSVPVIAPPTATLSGTNSICPGLTTQLTLALTGTAPWSFTWTDGTTPQTLTGITTSPYLITVTPSVSTTYLPIAVSDFYTFGTLSGSTEITHLPLARVVSGVNSNQVQCLGFNLNWNASQFSTHYLVDVASDTGFVSPISGYQSLNVGNVTTLSVVVPTPGTNYYARVRSVNGCNTSAPSIRANIATANLQAALTVTGSTAVCQGNTLQLSASAIPGATFQWSGPSGFSANTALILRSLMQVGDAGVYSLIANAAGCNSAQLAPTVAVNQLLTQAIGLGNTPLCAGEVMSLTATGGYQNSTYLWTGPNGFTSSTQNPIRYSVVAADSGIYTITITSPGCNSISDTAWLNVLPTLPITVTSSSPICDGSNLYFSATWIPGNIYQWTGPSGFIWTGNTPSIPNATSFQAGDYTLSVNQPGCNGPLTYVTPVVVNPQFNTLTLNSNSPICNLDTLNISLTQVPGSTYTWTGPNGFSASGDQVVFPGATSNMTGGYSVHMYTPGCGNYYDDVNVIIGVLPSVSAYATPPLVCIGNNVDLYGGFGVIPGATYQWNGPNGFRGTQHYVRLAQARSIDAGVYTVGVTVQGCGAVIDTVQVFVATYPTITTTNNNPVCSGNTLQISATSINGVTYNWAGPNGFTSQSNALSFTNAQPSLSGGYTVTVNRPGCTQYIQDVNVVVNTSPVLNAYAQNPILCVGGNLDLFAAPTITPQVTYSWQGPNGFTSNQFTTRLNAVQLSDAGVYTVDASVAGCSAVRDTVQFFVSPQPNVLSGTNSPVCLGGQLILSATQINGITYSWVGPNGYSSNRSRDTLSPVLQSMGGAYVLIASAAGCTNVSQGHRVIINDPGQMFASSNSPVCSGGTLQLTSRFVSGASYSWSGPAGFTSNIATPSFINALPINAGIYTLVVNYPNCGTLTFTTTVQIGNSLNFAVGTTGGPICSGNTLTLSATIISEASYFWQGPNSFTSNQANTSIPNAPIQAGGTYSVTIQTPGCLAVTRLVTTTVNTPLSAASTGNTPICQGGNLYLSALLQPNATYAWSGPGGFTSTLQAPSLTNLQLAQSGTYSVTVSRTGCSPISSSVNIVVGPTLTGITLGTNSPVCLGQTLYLSTTQRTGVTAYNWTGPNGYTSGTAQDSVTPVTAGSIGVYTVSITSPGCGVLTLTTAPVQVNDGSTIAATGNSPICQGATLQLSTANLPGSTYTWNGPNGYSSTLRTPSFSNIQPINTGLYSLTVNMPGCGLFTRTVSIQVGANFSGLTRSTNSPVCLGGNLTLSVLPGVSGHTYQWTGPNGFTSSRQIDTLVNTVTGSAGVYSVRVTSLGCGVFDMTTAPVQINNPATLIANSNTPCSNLNQNLNLVGSNVAGYSNYIWYGPAGYSYAGRIAVRSPSNPSFAGVYTLTATLQSCGVVSAYRTVTIRTNCREGNQDSLTEISYVDSLQANSIDSLLQVKLANASHSISTLEAWPNPNDGTSVTLFWTGLSEKDPNISLKVYDLEGKLIYLRSLDRDRTTDTWKEQLKFGTTLSRGIYLIESVHNSELKYIKLIVQ